MHYQLAANTFGPEEREAMLRVINNQHYTIGKHVKQFESTFAEKFQSKYAVMANSGSSANLVAVAALFYHKNSASSWG